MSRPRAIHHVNKCVTAQLLYVLCPPARWKSSCPDVSSCKHVPLHPSKTISAAWSSSGHLQVLQTVHVWIFHLSF